MLSIPLVILFFTQFPLPQYLSFTHPLSFDRLQVPLNSWVLSPLFLIFFILLVSFSFSFTTPQSQLALL